MQQTQLMTPEFTGFYGKYIKGKCREPYLSIVLGLLAKLEAEGMAVPSVLDSTSEKEPDRRFSRYLIDNLSLVSVATHSLYVAEESIKLLYERRETSTSIFYPVLVIAALGCDLGKLRASEDSQNYFGHHPRVSSIAVEKCLHGLNQAEAEVVITAIGNHHQRLKNDHTVVRYTRIAQERARIREIYELALDINGLASQWDRYSYKPYQFPYGNGTREVINPSWFEWREFVDCLHPLINTTNSNEAAISMRDGKTYIYLNLLFKVFRRLSLEHNWREILLYEGENESYQMVLAFVVKALAKAKVVPDEFTGWKYFGLYDVHLNNGKTIGPCAMVPLYSEIFESDLSILESRKLGWASQVKYISLPKKRR